MFTVRVPIRPTKFFIHFPKCNILPTDLILWWRDKQLDFDSLFVRSFVKVKYGFRVLESKILNLINELTNQSGSTKRQSKRPNPSLSQQNILLHGFTRTFCQCRSDSICQFWSRGICQCHRQLCSLYKHCTQSQQGRPFVRQLS